MKHPLLFNHNLRFFYILFWICIGTCSVFLYSYWYKTDYGISILESAFLFALYPLLALPIWYLVSYNIVKNVRLLYFVFHLILSTIINAVWLCLCSLLVKIVQPDFLPYFYIAFPSWVINGYMLYVFYLAFFYAVNYYYSLKEKGKKESELLSLIRDAELSALKSQINPHFLFNSLNSISSLTISSPEKAQEMVINLSSFMRYSLQHNREETVPLRQELDNIELYLNIEKIRFGGKLNVDFQIEESCLTAQIPNLILQPLMENAIKYGVYEASEPVWIRLHCRALGDWFFISVENDYDFSSNANKGEGIGLRNIRKRLEFIYGSQGQMKIKDNKSSFKVELGLPFELNKKSI